MPRPNENERERLIRFIQPWIEARPQQYEPRVGYHGLGYKLRPCDLSDDALIGLADRIRRDFWSSRRLNRENRRIDDERKLRA